MQAALARKPEESQSHAASKPAAGSGAPAGAPVFLQRQPADGWAPEYKTKRVRPGNLPYEKYKDQIGKKGAEEFAPEIKSASEWGGTPLMSLPMTRQELGEIILPEKPQDAESTVSKLNEFFPHINPAFEVMEINTVEAQAAYLAHFAGETGLTLSEVRGEQQPYAPFFGRGPVQVTWETGYLQTLAYLEVQAERLTRRAERADQAALEGPEQLPGDPLPALEYVKNRHSALIAAAARARAEAALAREAVVAIKADITKAADPRFAFLFSAAYMHWTRGVKSTASLGPTAGFPGNAPEDRWVAGKKGSFETRLAAAQKEGNTKAINELTSAISRAKVKSATYGRAVQVLGRRALPKRQSAKAGP